MDFKSIAVYFIRSFFKEMGNRKVLIFDWGNTLMRDFPDFAGPMVNWSKVEVIDNVSDTLSVLKEKYLLCVATNAGESDTNLMLMALKRGKIDNYFDYAFSSKELGVSKPDVNFFISICNKMKVCTTNCVMIGNDYDKDIVGAKDAGLKTILFDEFNTYNLVPKSDFVINNIKELLKIL